MSNAADIAEIETLVKQIWDHFVAQEPAKMLALLHPQCTVWDVFQPDLVTRRDMEDYVEDDFSQSAARGTLTHRMSDFVTTVWGDAAICRFKAYHKYDPPNPHEGYGRTTCVLRRFPDEGWMVVHVHEGAIPSGIPPLSDRV
jgi:ketosteroid isomerase-like protein